MATNTVETTNVSYDLIKKNRTNIFLNRYFNLSVVIFTSFLLLMSYLLLLKPKVDETKIAISENIISHEKLLQAEKDKLSGLQAAIASYGEVNQVDLDRVNAILPNDYDKEALYGEIEEIVKQNGFVPTSIALFKEGEETKDNNTQTNQVPINKVSDNIGLIKATVTISSIDYAGLKNLLTVFENNLRLIDVQHVSLSDGNVATLEFLTYYYKTK
jgi:hypothetical protein